MRLWHAELIPHLPNKLLVNQWRELCVVQRALMYHQKMPVLCRPLLEQDPKDLQQYSLRVARAMHKRNFRVGKAQQRLLGVHLDHVPEYRALFPEWHTQRYLVQNLMNLQEKLDCGILNQEEWDRLLLGVEQQVENRSLLDALKEVV